MLNFNWQIPTKFIFGRGAESHAGEELKALGGTRALIHYGGGSVIRSGLMEKVTKSLDCRWAACSPCPRRAAKARTAPSSCRNPRT